MKIKIKQKKKRIFVKKKGELRGLKEFFKKLIKLGLIVLIGFVIYAIYKDTKYKQNLRIVYTDMEELNKAIKLFRYDFGRCPKKLNELLYPPANKKPYIKKPPLDPWGKEYYFLCPGKWHENGADLSSSGPDKKFFTEDDITNVI